MGESKCAFEGCNALEFRTSGYCLRHKGVLLDEKNPDTTSKPEKNSGEPVTEDWRIPIIALGYFPFAAFLFWLAEFFDAQVHNAPWLLTIILVYTALIMILLLVFILPLYATYLVRLTRQRIKNGTNSIAVTMFHLLSFTIPLLGLLMFWLFASAQGA